MTVPRKRWQPNGLQLYAIIFAGIFLLHAPLLRLPFFWDEAGFYIPAAYDLTNSHSLIPVTTLDTGHPPLSAAYLAFWFAVSGWKPAVARIAMLLLAAFALTNVFLLARRVANTGVAVASTVATAMYPVFFAQSSLAHADLTAAALTLWGIRLVMEHRLRLGQLAFCLAVLSKETAIITPLALGLWELFRPSSMAQAAAEAATRTESASAGVNSIPARLRSAAIYLVPILPLLAWLIYHHHVTGRFLGNAEYFQYNVTQVINPLRILLAIVMRLWHLFGIMNMLAMTAAMLVAMRFPPVIDQRAGGGSEERRRIAIPVQLQFAAIMLAHVVTFSVLGGAMLTRYLLAAYPLVIILGMSTLRRRIMRWEWPAAVMVICFIMALVFDPLYRFAPEDNLTYRDYVELHVQAAHFLAQHEKDATVLTAWPASDELSKPYLGYAAKPHAVVAVKDFTVEELVKARQMRSQYQVAYLFSTKYEASTWFRSALWERLNTRFFDYHRDLSPQAAAEMLGGRVVFVARTKAEWVEIIEMEQPSMEAAGRNTDFK
jgi:dolichyl-phosphate-mannose-protein mannosyltransferase